MTLLTSKKESDVNNISRCACALLCLQLSGCTGMRMYSEQRDQQGKNLESAWAKVELKRYFVPIAEQRMKLLGAKVEGLAGAGAVLGGNAVAALLDSRIGIEGDRGHNSFHGKLDVELNALIGQLGRADARKLVNEWLSLSQLLRINRARQDVYRKLIRAEGGAAPACPVAGTPGAAFPDGDLAEYRSVLAGLCAGEKDMSAKQTEMLGRLPAGQLQASRGEVARKEQEYKDASSKVDSQMVQYRETLDRYAAAAVANQAGSAPSQALLDAGAKVRAALGVLQSAGNVAGKEAVANDRLNRIDAIFKKLGTTEDPGKDATRAELAAVLVTRIANDARILADLHKPLIPMSLLIQRNLEKNRVELARTQAGISRKEIELSRDVQTSKMIEASYLLRARVRLAEVRPCYRGMTLLDAVALPAIDPLCDDAASRAAIYDAAGLYGHAIGSQRAHTSGLEVQRSGFQQESALAYNQANAEQWAVLIDATAGQAVAAAASGQKASDYKDVMQLLSLLWIGKGVNK